MPSPEWHWEQGSKFAVEGIKTSLLLNGVAAIALMTFANTHGISNRAIIALSLFALGAIISAIAFVAAYHTQLFYGSAEVSGATDKGRIWKKGALFNIATTCLVLLSVTMFAFGIAFATLWLGAAQEERQSIGEEEIIAAPSHKPQHGTSSTRLLPIKF